MKKRIFMLSLCSILLLSTGCKKSVKLKNGNEVIASVKGKKITAEELYEKLKEDNGSTALVTMIDNYIVSKEITDDKDAKKYANAQITSLKKQYEEAGYDWDNALAQNNYTEDKLRNEYIIDYKKQETAKKYIKKEITEDEINEYYEKEIYGNYTVKHILISPKSDSNASEEEKEKAKKEAKEKAEKIIKKLDKGEKWADLVKEYSDDKGSKDDEGLIKDFTKGDVVDEFFNATLELKNGKYTKEPVESTYGYHIILKVSNTKKPSLKKSKEKILNEVAQNKLNNDDKLSNTTWAKIRKEYKLTIEDSTVKKAYDKSINQ